MTPQKILFKEGEIHPAVFAVLIEVIVGGEGERAGMFKNEGSAFSQDFRAENFIRQSLKQAVIIGRIGKYNVERLVGLFEVSERVPPDHIYHVHVQFHAGGADEREMGVFPFKGNN